MRCRGISRCNFSRPVAALALGAVGFFSGCGSSDEHGSPPPGTPVDPRAAGLRISEVAFYQALKVPLMAAGSEVSFEQRGVPAVLGRDALLRVFVTPEPDWQPREVTVRLELENDAGALPAQEIRRVVEGPSSEADFMSAFNFDIPKEQVAPGLRYSVVLLEVTVERRSGSTDGAAFPAGGKAAITPMDTGGPLRVVIVPIRYDADGSQRLPDTSEEQIRQFRELMFSLYPVSDVELSVREPLAFTGALTPTSGWGTLLQSVAYARLTDGVPRNVYYYGVVRPTDSLFQYCPQGCIGGLSAGGQDPNDDLERASVGVGYGGGLGGSLARQTFVHEVGHAHGRLHSPCAPEGLTVRGVDLAYPHAEAGIGTWGYDQIRRQLIAPDGASKDMMGYCQPYWISDYTYRALADRIAFVNGLAYFAGSDSEPVTWRSFSIEPDGMIVRGYPLPLRRTPSGEPREIAVTDAAGRTRRLTGHYYPYHDLPGGMLLLPELSPFQASALDGRVVLRTPAAR